MILSVHIALIGKFWRWKPLFQLDFETGRKVPVLTELFYTVCENIITLYYLLIPLLPSCGSFFCSGMWNRIHSKSSWFSDAKYTHCRSLDSSALKKLKRSRKSKEKGHLILKDSSKLNWGKDRNFNGIFLYSKLRTEDILLLFCNLATGSRYKPSSTMNWQLSFIMWFIRGFCFL